VDTRAAASDTHTCALAYSNRFAFARSYNDHDAFSHTGG
jgi:hypothetical protein